MKKNQKTNQKIKNKIEIGQNHSLTKMNINSFSSKYMNFS